MPRQDAQGRWISDDGAQYWDGFAWRPLGMAAPARRGVSVAQPILIGTGFVLIVLLVLTLGMVMMFRDPDAQRSFCNGWNRGENHSTENLACPFSPPSP